MGKNCNGARRGSLLILVHHKKNPPDASGGLEKKRMRQGSERIFARCLWYSSGESLSIWYWRVNSPRRCSLEAGRPVGGPAGGATATTAGLPLLGAGFAATGFSLTGFAATGFSLAAFCVLASLGAE